LIEIPTTFVVGAGASRIYELPTGGDLLAEARNLQSHNDVFQRIIKGRPELLEPLREFIKAATAYSGPSIDALIENQPKQDEVARLVIAGLMGSHLARLAVERPTIKSDTDWLLFVVERMRRGCGASIDRFCEGNRNVAFVTFNFDRQIEDRLVLLARNIFGVQAEKVLDSIEVIHVHGALPPSPEVSTLWIQTAAPEIRIIHDKLDPTVVDRARSAIGRADVVCFLGFSFQSDNLSTLDLPRSFKGSGSPEVFGTTRGMATSDVADVLRQFNRSPPHGTLLLKDLDCIDLLRDQDIVRCQPGPFA
jgi:hypothetical protein